MKYFLYVRKSSEEEEKQALSLSAQREYARDKFPELELIELPDESASAFKPNNRPIFEEMLRRIDAGEAHGIVAWHPDRLSRNELDAAAITYRIRTGAILDMKFGSYTFDNSPEGIMMLQIVMSQSQYFSSKLSKDVKRGNAKKIKLGWKPGWAPTGYLNTPELEKGAKTIVKDPERFNTVRKMWDLMLTGNYSVPEILDIAEFDWGFKIKKARKKGEDRTVRKEGPLSRSALYGIFTNPFYAGRIRYNGAIHKGSHPAMVTIAEYDRVQTLLGKKGRPRPKSLDFTYRGPISCGECGCMVTAETKRKYVRATGETKEYVYYHCTRKRPCSQKYSITEEDIEENIEDILSSITILPKFRDWALQVLRENNDQEIEDRTQIQKSQSKGLLAAQKQLDNLTRMRLSDLLTDEEYISQKERIAAEITRLREQLSDTEDRAEKWLELTEKAFDFATNARSSFQGGDEKTKREIFLSLGNGFKLRDKKLEVELNDWFVPIQKSYPAIEAAFNKVRTNENYGSKEEKTAALATVKSSWLPGSDSNRQPRS